MKTHSRITLAALLVAVTLLAPLSAAASNIERVARPATGWDDLGNRDPEGAVHHWSRLGQRLTIPGHRILSIGYMVCKVGEPEGDIILSIRDSDTDEVIVSKVWGCASELPERADASGRYIEVEFATPVWVRGDVRISVEYYDGDEDNHAKAAYHSGNRIDGQFYTNYLYYGYWHDIGEAEEGAYMYTYLADGAKPPPNGNNENGESGGLPVWVIIVVAGAALVVFAVTLSKRRES